MQVIRGLDEIQKKMRDGHSKQRGNKTIWAEREQRAFRGSMYLQHSTPFMFTEWKKELLFLEDTRFCLPPHFVRLECRGNVQGGGKGQAHPPPVCIQTFVFKLCAPQHQTLQCHWPKKTTEPCRWDDVISHNPPIPIHLAYSAPPPPQGPHTYLRNIPYS